MNAIIRPQLSDQERAEVRKELYKEKILDLEFVADAIRDAKPITAASIKSAAAKRDWQVFAEMVGLAVLERVETELAEKAEQELLSSKSVNGARYLEA